MSLAKLFTLKMLKLDSSFYIVQLQFRLSRHLEYCYIFASHGKFQLTGNVSHIFAHVRVALQFPYIFILDFKHRVNMPAKSSCCHCVIVFAKPEAGQKKGK